MAQQEDWYSFRWAKGASTGSTGSGLISSGHVVPNSILPSLNRNLNEELEADPSTIKLFSLSDLALISPPSATQVLEFGFSTAHQIYGIVVVSFFFDVYVHSFLDVYQRGRITRWKRALYIPIIHAVADLKITLSTTQNKNPPLIYCIGAGPVVDGLPFIRLRILAKCHSSSDASLPHLLSRFLFHSTADILLPFKRNTLFKVSKYSPSPLSDH